MHIAIDGNEANVDQKVGVSMYAYELLKRFNSWADQETRFTVVLRHPPRAHMPVQHKYFKYHIVPGPFLWRDIFLPVHLAVTRSKPDVFFSPAHYTPLITSIPIVVTIHDLSYIYYPHEFLQQDLYKLNNWTKHAAHQAAKVITVTEFTRQDVLKNYHINEHKVVTIHNGYTHEPYTPSSIDHDIEHPYILYVGTIQPRKNITTLIKAFKPLLPEVHNMKLVIAGKKGWMYDEIFNMVKELGLEHHVKFTGYVPDEELPRLYAQASVFVHPSLYEGFGIPILEAMHYGCPVIAASGSSLEEVGGNACLYFDPHDEKELKGRLAEVLSNDEVRKDLVEKGYNNVKKFSWDKSARETLSQLKSI